MPQTEATLFLSVDQDLSCPGCTSFTNISNVLSESGAAGLSIDVGDDSTYLRVLNPDFASAIPNDATIDGIEITIRAGITSGPSPLDFTRVNLLRNTGTYAGENKQADHDLTTGIETITWGGPTDLWLTTWTPSQINDAGTGFVFRLAKNVGATTTASIEWVKITVYHSGGSPSVSGGVALGAVQTGGVVDVKTDVSGGVMLSPVRTGGLLGVPGVFGGVLLGPIETGGTFENIREVLGGTTLSGLHVSGTLDHPGIIPGNVDPVRVTRSSNFQSVTLTWTAATNAVSYIVYMQTGRRKDYVQVATPSTNTWNTSGLDKRENYGFRVVAISSTADRGQVSSPVYSRGDYDVE